MPSLVYPSFEDAFLGLLAFHKAEAVELAEDTIVPMTDDHCCTPIRKGQVRYGQGAIINVANALWAVGFGAQHCPAPNARILADIAAIRIVLPDEAHHTACVAPPPRDPRKILHETLVTNEELQHSILIALTDGRVISPRHNAFHDVIAHNLPLIRDFESNPDRASAEAIMYANSFPIYLQNCMHNALVLARLRE